MAEGPFCGERVPKKQKDKKGQEVKSARDGHLSTVPGGHLASLPAHPHVISKDEEGESTQHTGTPSHNKTHKSTVQHPFHTNPPPQIFPIF